MSRRQVLKVAIAAGCALIANTVFAQSDKPISLVLGYSAGGTTDFVARTVAVEMSKALGRQIIVDNVPGASGMLAAQKVSNGPTDGSMIYLGGTDTVVIPMVNKKIKVNWEKDFQLLGRSSYVSMVLAVSVKSKYNTLQDLLADLRKGKNDFTYASPGIGTMQHIFGSALNTSAKVSMVHVPYKGGAQITTDVIGGHVDSGILTTTSAMQFIKDGSIKILTIADTVRSPALPNVKAIVEEEGLTKMAMPLWQAFFVKAGTPPAIVSAYEKALLTAVANPEVQTKFKEAGATPAPLDGKAMTAYVKEQSAVYKEAIDSAKIAAE